MKIPFPKVSGGKDHLLVISQVPPPVHGSTVMTEVFLGSLDRLGLDWTLVDRRFSTRIDEVGTVTIRKALAALGLIGRLTKAIVNKNPTAIVFFCTTRTFSFLMDWMLSEIIMITRIPLVNYIHTEGYRHLADKNLFLRFMVRRMLGGASQTVCLGPSLYADVSRWVARETVTFIANTPLGVHEVSDEPERTPRRVTFLSNFIPGKGIDIFLQVAIALAAKYPDLVFDVVGAAVDKDQDSRVRSVVSDAGVSERFNFAGAVYGAEKWKYLQESALLVFPSHSSEAQPLTIIEAFACATPVAAFAIGGIVDLIDDGQNGLLVESVSHHAMLEAVDMLLAAPHLLNLFGKQAASDFAQRYSHETYQLQWSKVLTKCGLPAATDSSHAG